jgi:hypothetical protein
MQILCRKPYIKGKKAGGSYCLPAREGGPYQVMVGEPIIQSWYQWLPLRVSLLTGPFHGVLLCGSETHQCLLIIWKNIVALIRNFCHQSGLTKLRLIRISSSLMGVLTCLISGARQTLLTSQKWSQNVCCTLTEQAFEAPSLRILCNQRIWPNPNFTTSSQSFLFNHWIPEIEKQECLGQKASTKKKNFKRELLE